MEIAKTCSNNKNQFVYAYTDLNTPLFISTDCVLKKIIVIIYLKLDTISFLIISQLPSSNNTSIYRNTTINKIKDFHLPCCCYGFYDSMVY